MNIIITQRHSTNKHGDWIDSLENSYIRYFESFGFCLIPVSNITGNIQKYFEELHISGIILSGGGDVDPGLYNSEYNPNQETSESRDKVESDLLRESILSGIPVLGICRGMHLINVFFGGSLCNIMNIDKNKIHLCPSTHEIELQDENLIKLVKDKNHKTNSYHNQGILLKNLAKDLIVFAVFKELNLVEGFYHSKYPIAGIQWHPERNNLPTELDNKIIELFKNKRLYWGK